MSVLQINVQDPSTPLDVRLLHICRRFLQPGLEAEVSAQQLKTAAEAQQLYVRAAITSQLPQKPPHNAQSTPLSPVHEVLELQGGLSTLSQGYQVHCAACGYVSTPSHGVQQLQQLLLCKSHVNPSTGSPCHHVKQLQDTHNLLQRLPAHATLSTAPQQTSSAPQSPGTAAADPLSPRRSKRQAHAAAAAATSPAAAPAGGGPQEEAQGPSAEPQAARFMALVLANLALHIISTTGGSGSRGKPKGSSTDLTPWRPWAIQLLTEDFDLIELSNWVRPSPAALISTLTAPAAPTAADTAPEAAAAAAAPSGAAAASAAAAASTTFRDASSIPASILDMLLAPPWPAISEPNAVDNLALERLAVLLRHWHTWLQQHRPEAAAAAAAALSNLGYMLEQRKDGLQVLLEGLLALDPVCKTLPEQLRLQLFLGCAGISGSVDQALTKLDKALKAKPHVAEHLEVCVHCGLSANKLRPLYYREPGSRRQGSAAVLNRCSNCLVSVCIPCVLAAAGRWEPGQAISVGDAEASEAGECWPGGLCYWCAGSSEDQPQHLLSSPPRAAGTAAAAAVGKAAGSAAAAGRVKARQQQLRTPPRVAAPAAAAAAAGVAAGVANSTGPQQRPSPPQPAAAAAPEGPAVGAEGAAAAGAAGSGGGAAAAAAGSGHAFGLFGAAGVTNSGGDRHSGQGGGGSSNSHSGSGSDGDRRPAAAANLGNAVASAVAMIRRMQQLQGSVQQDSSHESSPATSGAAEGSHGAAVGPAAALAAADARHASADAAPPAAAAAQQQQRAAQPQLPQQQQWRQQQLQQQEKEQMPWGVQEHPARMQAMQEVLAAFQQLSPEVQKDLLQQVRERHARRSSTDDSTGCETPAAAATAAAAAAAAPTDMGASAAHAPTDAAVSGWCSDDMDTDMAAAAAEAAAPGVVHLAQLYPPVQHNQQQVQQAQQHKRQRQAAGVEGPGSMLAPQQKQPRLLQEAALLDSSAGTAFPGAQVHAAPQDLNQQQVPLTALQRAAAVTGLGKLQWGSAGQLPPRYHSRSAAQPAPPSSSPHDASAAAAAAAMRAFQGAAAEAAAAAAAEAACKRIPGHAAVIPDPAAAAAAADNGWAAGSGAAAARAAAAASAGYGAAGDAAAAAAYGAAAAQDTSRDMHHLDDEEQRALEALLDMRLSKQQQHPHQKQHYARQQHVQQRDQELIKPPSQWRPEAAAAAFKQQQQKERQQQEQQQLQQLLQQQLSQAGFRQLPARSQSPAASFGGPLAGGQQQQQPLRRSTASDSGWEMTPEAPSVLHHGLAAYGNVAVALQGLQQWQQHWWQLQQQQQYAALHGAPAAPMSSSQSPQVQQALQLQLQELGAAAEGEASRGLSRQTPVSDN